MRLLVLIAMLGFGAEAPAQAFPTKPVRLMLWSAGSFPDLVARRMADQLSARWGQPVIVENRPGAAGILAADAAAKAPPDGHTLAWGDPVGWEIHLRQAKEASGAPGELVPVSLAVEVPMVLFVGAQLPVRTLKELIEVSRSREPALFYATPGVHSIHDLTFQLLAQRSGLRLQHAPYKAMSQITTDVAAGQVAAAMSGLGSIAGFLKDGRIRALAWSGAARFAALPDVPTFAEAGVPDFVVTIKGGFYAHKATPPGLIERLGRDLGEAARSPEVAQFVARAGAVAIGSTPQEFLRIAQKDIDLFSGLCCPPSR